MRTSIRNRLLRLGILCAGVAAFLVAIFAVISLLVVTTHFSGLLESTVVQSAVSSVQEEAEYLPNGLIDAEPGEPNDIFENVFLLGESRGYDYSFFQRDCASLAPGEVNFAFISSGNLYLTAYNRGGEVIVGELESDYFDYAINIMNSNKGSGYVVNNKTGTIMMSTERDQCGRNIAENKLFTDNFNAAKAGQSCHKGGAFSKYLIYSEILPDYPGISVLYFTEASNVYHIGMLFAVLILLWALFLTGIGVVVSIGIAKKISGSITPTTDCLRKFSEGVFDTEFRANSRGDETEILSKAMEDTIRNIGAYIRDIDTILSGLAHGNLTVNSSCAYQGEFNNIKNSLEMISSSLKQTISTISSAGEQVSGGVGMLASGAQSLANNSATEVSTLKELDTLVNGINANVTNNAAMTEQMRTLSNSAVESVRTGNENMGRLSDAISDIRSASEEINSIAKQIDDIAFQTNILALNASVEAARAGEAGKGFAIVAEEVRNLASKSADAAQDAVQVIGRCVAAVNQGVTLNESASRSLDEIYDSVNAFSALVGKVADASAQQAQDIGTVTNGLGSITAIVQNNAATAEESAASSAQIANQAERLKDELEKFKV